jgi:hypothetical protein
MLFSGILIDIPITCDKRHDVMYDVFRHSLYLSIPYEIKYSVNQSEKILITVIIKITLVNKIFYSIFKVR